MTPTGTVSGGVVSSGSTTPQTTPQPEIQGACVYIFGNVSGIDYNTSPTGVFTTPKLGNLVIGRSATVSGKSATVKISDKSAYKASGTLELTTKSGKALGTGKFSLSPEKSGVVTIKLTASGTKAASAHRAATLVLTSNWDQPSNTKSIKL